MPQTKLPNYKGGCLIMLSKIGFGEIIVILVVALLIFGPDKLPQLGRSVGKAIGSVKKYMNETTEELKEAMEDVEDIGKEVKDISTDLKTAKKEPYESSHAQTPDAVAAPGRGNTEAGADESSADAAEI